MPTRKSQLRWVAKQLIAGRAITSKIANRDRGITRLASRINDLKHELTNETNLYWDEVIVASYSSEHGRFAIYTASEAAKKKLISFGY
jgi:20S proteasome alpha/beta subunit